jgi:hypothetical protein
MDRRALGSLVVVLAGLLAAACTVDTATDDQSFTYACQDQESGGGCGEGWTCYRSGIFGTADICQPAAVSGCAEGQVAAGGACLTTCDPTADNCPTGGVALSCLRTSYLANRGLCYPIEACTASSDCTDPVRSVCLSESARHLPGGSQVKLDHTYCIAAGCQALGTACQPGFACLPDAVNPLISELDSQLGTGASSSMAMDLTVPDICVPQCSPSIGCPPGFTCSADLTVHRILRVLLGVPESALSGVTNDTLQNLGISLCLAGFINYPCSQDLDCLEGTCQGIPDDATVKRCAVSCTGDADCATFVNVANKPWVCSPTLKTCVPPPRI